MKKNVKLITALAVTAFIGTSVAALACYIGLEKQSVSLPPNFTVTAHTGCEDTEDNSLEAIKKGFECGAHIVEFDLNFTADGLPVLAHDEPGENSVTLGEAFGLIAEYENLAVNVDCKKTDNLKAVVQLSEKYGIRDRIFYTGIEEKDVEAVKNQTPDVAYYLNVPKQEIRSNDIESLTALAEKVESLGAVGINMKYTKCSKELVDVFHSKGLSVSVWTVNDRVSMLRTLPMGADNITTRYPSALKEIIEKKTNK